MAQANVGVMYYLGQGTEKSLEHAIKWLTAAADNNDNNGLFNLASVVYINCQSNKQIALGERHAAHNGTQCERGLR